MARSKLTIVPDLEEELGRLYGLPPEEFTAARNELAARLAKAGRPEAAADVKALAKPSVSAWAVNQAVRRHPAKLERLLEAGGALVEAQAVALGGKGADALRRAVEDEREAVDELARAARVVLAGRERRSSEAVLDRVAATLRAASLDEAGRRLLRAGRLTVDVESTGFDLLAGMEVAAAPRRDERREQELLEAREEVKARRAEARAAARAASKAQAAAERAGARLAEAEDALARLERPKRRGP